MKKFLSILLIALLTFGTVACDAMGTISANSMAQSALSQKLKKICEKDIVKKLLDGKKISDLVKDSIDKMSSTDRENALEQMPGISFDPKYFATEDSTYAWITEAAKSSIKYAIDNGQLTQEQIDQAKGMLALMGISLPDIKVEKGITEADISKLCDSFLDVADRITNPETLKLLGIDINDPSTFDNIAKNFVFK